MRLCRPPEAPSTAGAAVGARPLSTPGNASRETLTRQQRHAALIERVMTGSEKFRQLQVSAFRARLVRDLPDLEDRILYPLLAAPQETVAGVGDDPNNQRKSVQAPCSKLLWRLSPSSSFS